MQKNKFVSFEGGTRAGMDTDVAAAGAEGHGRNGAVNSGAPEASEAPMVFNNLSHEEVVQMRDNARTAQHGISRQVSEALRRGNTMLERSSAWPFDIYQATGLYPVDYKYWERPVQTSVGPSKCIAMHAHAYTPNFDQIAADQVFHREIMKEAHTMAIQNYMRDLDKAILRP